MKPLSHADAFEVLCLQAADEGRGEVLFGDGLNRARKLLRPFMVGEKFPSVYLEFPLAGEPFLDVTVLYSELEEGVRIESKAAVGTGEMLDWFARAQRNCSNISCGFEVDTERDEGTAAAIHFQPRGHYDLVEPYCEVVGEPHCAELYLDLAKRMPRGWGLSFFGMFRGRPGSPLRVCGYLDDDQKARCQEDTRYLVSVFSQIGFGAYDDAMLAQVSRLMAVAPGALDFQFDIYPNGQLGNVFSIDAQFEIERPELVQASFADGRGARVMTLLEQWGIVDERWKLGAQAAFARAIPVELEDGTAGRYSLVLMPQWVKVRWRNGVLQPAKLYHWGHAGVMEDGDVRVESAR